MLAKLYHLLTLSLFLLACSGGYVDTPAETEPEPFDLRLEAMTNPLFPRGVPLGAHPAYDTVRQPTGVRNAVPTPNKQPLANSVRLGNSITLPGTYGGVAWNPLVNEQLLNIDLQGVAQEADDAYIHSPGSWVLTINARQVGDAANTFSPLLANITVGNGGSSDTLQVSLFPSTSIALPVGTVKVGIGWDPYAALVPNAVPPTSVQVNGFVHRSFTAGNAKRVFFVPVDNNGTTPNALLNGLIPSHAYDVGVYTAAATWTLLGAPGGFSFFNGSESGGAVTAIGAIPWTELLTNQYRGYRLPVPAVYNRYSVSYVVPADAVNPLVLDFGVRF